MQNTFDALSVIGRFATVEEVHARIPQYRRGSIAKALQRLHCMKPPRVDIRGGNRWATWCVAFGAIRPEDGRGSSGKENLIAYHRTRIKKVA